MEVSEVEKFAFGVSGAGLREAVRLAEDFPAGGLLTGFAQAIGG
jgi:hypothetical protein